jgi:ABC-type methionine transport system ATPase subunit
VSGDDLINLLVTLNKEKGKTIIMVTHDLEYLRFANKLFHIIDGELVEEFDNAQAIKMSASLRTKKGERTEKTVYQKDYLKSKNKNAIN